MKNFFKPEDFVYGMDRAVDQRAEISCNYANHKLNTLIESSPIVFGTLDADGNFWFPDPKAGCRSGTSTRDTHKARLFGIEPILREPCQHESEVYRNTWNDTGPRFIIDAQNTKCKHCRVELIAEWKEKK